MLINTICKEIPEFRVAALGMTKVCNFLFKIKNLKIQN